MALRLSCIRSWSSRVFPTHTTPPHPSVTRFSLVVESCCHGILAPFFSSISCRPVHAVTGYLLRFPAPSRAVLLLPHPSHHSLLAVLAFLCCARTGLASWVTCPGFPLSCLHGLAFRVSPLASRRIRNDCLCVGLGVAVGFPWIWDCCSVQAWRCGLSRRLLCVQQCNIHTFNFQNTHLHRALVFHCSWSCVLLLRMQLRCFLAGSRVLLRPVPVP